MVLFALIGAVLLFSLSVFIFPKAYKFCVAAAAVSVVLSYYCIDKNMFPANFAPTKNIEISFPLNNYYNILAYSFRAGHINLQMKDDYAALRSSDIYEKYDSYALGNLDLVILMDLSYYKEKLYMYFGLTPALLFYLPFNLASGMYMSDKIVLLIMSLGIFLLSLVLIKKLCINLPVKDPSVMFVTLLAVFFTGFCNYLPVLLSRPSTYEVSIACAAFLLLASLLLFIKYSNSQTGKDKYYLFFIGLMPALAVGARPHYVLFIPLFFAAVVYICYLKKYEKKQIIKLAAYFLIPCLICGFILAAYNYLRFDSIFEFGWKYQLNDMRLYSWTFEFKDFFTGLKYHLLCPPEFIGIFPFVSLAQAHGHRLGNELISGIISVFPLSIILLFLPFTAKNQIKDKKIITAFILTACVFIVNLFIASMAGITQRYVFEYMYPCVIMSLGLFYYLYESAGSRREKNLLVVAFAVLFALTLYVNTVFLFSESNSVFSKTNAEVYRHVMKFLS